MVKIAPRPTVVPETHGSGDNTIDKNGYKSE